MYFVLAKSKSFYSVPKKCHTICLIKKKIQVSSDPPISPYILLIVLDLWCSMLSYSEIFEIFLFIQFDQKSKY
jgi:hypothetical protein